MNQICIYVYGDCNKCNVFKFGFKSESFEQYQDDIRRVQRESLARDSINRGSQIFILVHCTEYISAGRLTSKREILCGLLVGGTNPVPQYICVERMQTAFYGRPMHN